MGKEKLNEVFVRIQGHPAYGINPFGVVKNLNTERILKYEITDRGYLRVKLDGEKHYVHKLVALTFLSNPNGSRYVIHKDGDRSNNSYDNLMWSDSYYM